MKLVILSLFLLVCPALTIHLCRRWPACDKLGPALICYGLGMLIANIGVLPDGSGPVQTMFMNISVPLALRSCSSRSNSNDGRNSRDARSCPSRWWWCRAAATPCPIFSIRSREESWKVAGMLIGVYREQRQS